MSSTMTIDQYGNKIWRNNKGEWHREGGPALECANGYKSWWFHGKCHRIDGPASEDMHGFKSWYVGGKWITSLVRDLLFESPFGEDVHLGILAEYFAERGDFRLLDIVQPFLAEQK